MQCFLHQGATAVGICRTCGKGICSACAREIDRGIVCSEVCAQFAIDTHEIQDRAKRIYSIGVKPRIPVGAWFFGTFGLLVLFITALLLWSDRNNWPTAALSGGFGVLFLVFAVFIWRRYRSVGLNL